MIAPGAGVKLHRLIRAQPKHCFQAIVGVGLRLIPTFAIGRISGILIRTAHFIHEFLAETGNDIALPGAQVQPGKIDVP